VGTLDVAVSNNGDLSIQSGGVVTAASRIDLGVLSTIAPGITVFGTATVTGAGSQLNLSNATGTLTVGDAGTGELTIKNGGVVTSNGQIIMGSQSSGRGVISVDGPGSTLNSQGAIYVRNNASLMEISGGGVVNGAGISIGPGNDADLVVTDSGSVLNNKGPLSVGSNGRGLLLIVRGGAVNNDGDAVIGAQPGSQGHAIVGGGNARWINAGSLNIGSLGSGVLDISNGRVSANTITIGTGGAVNISNGMLSANTITDHGILDNEPFTESQIDLNGSFILASDGTVGFGIKGNDNSDHTVLDISGSSLFQGTLRLDFLDGFTPKKGDTFDLINDPEGADFTGATFEVTGLGAGFKYSETFSDGMFILTALNNGINTTTTPEPGTLGLLAAALAINFGIHVKRRVAPRRQT
jgi:T5SS/PEP-CTERM-associated repeat protein